MMKFKSQQQLSPLTKPKKKTNTTRELPQNLYEYNGYYKYRNPNTGKTTSFGKDKKDAIDAAILSNLRLLSEERGVEFVERAIVGEDSQDKSITISALIERYQLLITVNKFKQKHLEKLKANLLILNEQICRNKKHKNKQNSL